MRRPEHALQIAVAHMLAVVLDPAKTWWTSIDHGVGKLGFKEAGIRKARGVKPGLPDMVILFKPPPRRVRPDHIAMNEICVLGIELKSDSGRLSDTQCEVALAWLDLGVAVICVARSLEDVQGILTDFGVPMRTRMNFFSGGGNERDERPATPRHPRPGRKRRSAKNNLPLVFG